MNQQEFDDRWRAALSQRRTTHHDTTWDHLLTDFPYDWSRYPVLRLAIERGISDRAQDVPIFGGEAYGQLSSMLRDARAHAIDARSNDEWTERATLLDVTQRAELRDLCRQVLSIDDDLSFTKGLEPGARATLEERMRRAAPKIAQVLQHILYTFERRESAQAWPVDR